MRLDRIDIEAFRGIDRLELDLDALTTVIGEPDCGKSSLLRAIARVLGPHAPDEAPAFSVDDLNRPTPEEDSRATTLAITLGLSASADDGLAGGLPGIEDGGVSLRVLGYRDGEAQVATTVEVLDRAGLPLEGVDAQALLARIRRRHPAIIVGGPRRTVGSGGEHDGERDTRLRTFLHDAARPDEPLTWDQLGEVRDDILQAGSRLAEELGPRPARRRSVLAMTDTPRALVTDLGSALAPDAERQRRISALWLLVAILDAVPEGGLGESAEPILLFDDIEANMHPTWLAAMAAVAFNLPFQQIVTTHSPEVLTWMPLTSLRRLSRGPDGIEAHSVHTQRFSDSDLRRLTFHVRLNRGGAFFARCWILVEGETEAWLVPEFARMVGVELPVEGIRVIEFAQCGIEPLMRLADDLGIAWVALADGDPAGRNYARRVQDHLAAHPSEGEVAVLPSRDIEGYLFRNGYAEVMAIAGGVRSSESVGRVIDAAIDRLTKPGLALLILEEADARGPAGVPPVLRELVLAAQRLARR